MAAVLARTGQEVTGRSVTGHPLYGYGGVENEVNEGQVNGYTKDEGKDNWRGINGQGLGERNMDGYGMDENGWPANAGRCFCCPYGYHIDREFLGSLVRSSERNGSNLQQLRKMHQRKLRHRQTMESLLMQSIPSSSSDFHQPEPEPVTPTTSDATESDVSLTEESSTNRDGTTASSILSELDETIAEALRAFDELMNSKRKPMNYLLNAEVSSCSDTGDTSVLSSTPSPPDSSVSLKSHSELNPADLSTDTPVEQHVRGSNPIIQARRKGKEETETSVVESNTTKAKPPPLYPKPLTSSRMDNQSQSHSQLNCKIPTKNSSADADSVPTLNNFPCNRGFPHMDEDTNLVKDSSKNHDTDCMFPMNDAQATRPLDDLSSSSDLTKALAVLLPIDGKVGAGTEALVRLRQYIISSLRQMRILEQQVKTIPVMQVRISVLKEEKKLLRLQLLSLQSTLPSAATVPKGSLEDGIAIHSLSPPTIPPMLTNRFNPYSSGAGSGLCSRCRSSLTIERPKTCSAISRETSLTKSHPVEMSNVKDVWRFQKQQSEEANDDDNQMSTTDAEQRNKRQLCKSISLNPSLLFDRKINPTQQKPEDFCSQTIVGSPTALLPNSSTFPRRPEATFKRGLSLNDSAKTVYQRSRELQERIASETNLTRNRWNAKSLEKIAGFRSNPGQEPTPKAFFNEPVKIRKVSLAQNTFSTTTPPPTTTTTTPPLLKPTPAQRQSFNAGIQCELLSTKTPAGTKCPQCHCVTNPRKPISRDAPRVCDAVSSSAATVNGRSLSQTPDVIVTHRQASLSGTRTQETVGERKESGREMNDDRMDSYSSKSVCADAQLKAKSKEVGCMTDEKLSKEVGCLTDEELSKEVGCMTAEELSKEIRCMTDEKLSKEVGCMTDEKLSKEVGCMTDEKLSKEVECMIDKELSKEVGCMTDKELSKEVGCMTDEELYRAMKSEAFTCTDRAMFCSDSKDVGCLTDCPLNNVVTREASSFTEMFMRDSKEVGCSTDLNLNEVVTRDASSLTDEKLFKGSSKEVGCLTDVDLSEVITCEASTITDKELLKGSSKEVGCSTDVLLDSVVTRDASSFTENEMFKGNSKDVGSLTDTIQVITRDASCLTDTKLFKGNSKEVGCFTDVSLNKVVTLDVSSFTEREMFPQDSKEVGCLTDVYLSQVVTRDASSSTDKELFDGNKGITRDVSCLTDKEPFKEYSKEVGCLTDVPINDVETRDSWSLTEKAMFKEYSKNVSCLTNEDRNNLVTRDATCFTEKQILNEDSKEVSCMTDHIVILTNDASCSTELSYCEKASQVCSSLQSNPTTNENPLSFANLDSNNCQTVNVASRTTGHCDTYGSDKLSKRNTHEVDCNTDSVFSAGDCELTGLSDTQSLCDGVAVTVTEVNNNRSENAPVVNEVLLNSVENSKTISHLEPAEHPGNPKILIDVTSDSQRYHQTTTTTAVESKANGDLARWKSKRCSLVLDGGEDAEKLALSMDISKITEKPSRPPLEKPTLNELPSFHVGESFLNEKLNSACKTYSTWLQDSTEVNSKQLNGSLKVIQQEWFSVSSQKTSSSVRVKQFIDAIAKFSPDITKHVVNMVDTNENTALHYSVSHRNFDLILFLLSTGVCDANRRNRAGCTAVMLASLVALETDEQRATMRRLIEASDVNVAATLTGQTALMLAASRDHRETVRMLLEAKANPNVQDLDGSTALMCASEHGYIGVVKSLLSHPGCDPSVCDNEGSTALSVAMEAGHRDIGVLLYAHMNYRKQTSQVVGRRHERKGSASSYKRP